MICLKCKEERSISDFLDGQLFCYKCVYLEKMSRPIPTRIHICIICEVRCVENRWKYCSDQCAKKGKTRHNDTYWTKKIPYL